MIGALDDRKNLPNLSETDNLFYIKAKLEGQELHVLLDSGASHNFILSKLV